MKPGRRSLDRSRAYVYMLQLQCGADLRCLFGIIGNVSNREILIIDLCDQILVKVSIIKGQVLIILRENLFAIINKVILIYTTMYFY